MSAVSSTFLSTVPYARIEERHFALAVVGLRFPPRARFERLGSGTQSDPAISSITNCDHEVSELFRTGTVEPMVNRSSSIPFLFFFRAAAIPHELLSSGSFCFQENLLAYYIFIRTTTDDRSANSE
jgi:hypothetical protein